MSEREAALAEAAMEAQDWERATVHAEAAVAGGYAPAVQILAACAYKRRDYLRAIAYLDELGARGGAAAVALLIRLHLLAGDAAKAWRMLQECCRANMFGPPLYDLPRWSGEAVAGRRIVAWGGGHGDDILFARFLPPLVRAGARVAVNCRPGLVRLLQGIPGVEAVYPLDVPVPWAEFQLQTAELPALLGAGAGQGWPDGHYLHAEPAAVSGSGMRIGLVWGSDARHWESADRTAALADMAALAEVPGVTLYSLQVGSHAGQAAPAPKGMEITDLAAGLRDFADTASIILGLDLLVTIDTATANLAGALGAHAWVALPFIADFRWGMQGDGTPWYPTVRCFRQPKPGDWRSVFAAMADALRATAPSRP